MRIYIAGPMRGYPKFNFPEFDSARDLGKSLGHDIISPADIDRDNGIDENSASPSFTDTDVREFASRDVAAILTCDAIAMLPGWEHSKGATAENALARWIGLKILDATTFDVLDKTVLLEAQRIVYNDRAKDYGHPLDECERIASFWSIIIGHPVKPEQIPLCMIGMKISREMNRRKRDNATDIAGYAECLNRIHEERERREKEVDEAS